MTYKFSYKRWATFKTVKVVGHSFSKDLDRMTLYLPDGGVRELAKWSDYDCKLGTDWVLAVKKDMEKRAGQPVVVNRGDDAH